MVLLIRNVHVIEKVQKGVLNCNCSLIKIFYFLAHIIKYLINDFIKKLVLSLLIIIYAFIKYYNFLALQIIPMYLKIIICIINV